MRHFTREMYEKMQIIGRFPLRTDNKEKWMKQLEGFCSVCHVNDKVHDALMFRYIPEVEDDILQGKKFTDREVSEKLYTSIKGMANELENVHKMYKTEYSDIKYKLPLRMQKFKKYIFHDDTVVSLKKDSRDMLKLELQRH